MCKEQLDLFPKELEEAEKEWKDWLYYSPPQYACFMTKDDFFKIKNKNADK